MPRTKAAVKIKKPKKLKKYRPLLNTPADKIFRIVLWTVAYLTVDALLWDFALTGYLVELFSTIVRRTLQPLY
jgi:hypothetical protein